VNADDAAAGIVVMIRGPQSTTQWDALCAYATPGRSVKRGGTTIAESLIADGVIAGGMVPKIRAALAALAWDGAEAIIADSSAERALERALTDQTFGTRISRRASAVGAA
jgi:acetylglutamate kinase